MTTQQDEQLSALIDGELDNANTDILITKLCNNEQDKQCWHRYHLISDTMKHKLPEAIDPSFSAAVMSAIEDEPAILAPKSRPTTHNPFFKRAAGVALAASVAVVAVFAVKTNVEQETMPQLAKMPSSDQFVRIAKQPASIASTDAAVSRLPSATPAMAVSSSSSQTAPVAKPIVKFDPRLHQYIMNHSQRVSGGQMQGIIPYARIVVTPSATQGEEK